MRNTLLVFLLLFFACCQNNRLQVGATDQAQLVDTSSYDMQTYVRFKEKVLETKSKLRDKPIDSASSFLFHLINSDIYQYWSGTKWDFNGTTQQPKEGNIACGYFVTNTLTDLGFKIQRIKLAQVVSSQMIKTLCVDVHRFASFEQLKTFLNAQANNSVYIIGLDFHTGYILKDSTGIYFMHSNYINRQGVVKEKIDQAQALLHNKSFMIGSLSANQTLLKNWIKE